MKDINDLTSLVMECIDALLSVNNSNVNDDGVWRTIRGHKIFIKKGQDVSEAFGNLIKELREKGHIKDKKQIDKTVKQSKRSYEEILKTVETSNLNGLTEEQVLKNFFSNPENKKYNKEDVLKKINDAEKYNKDVVITQKKYKEDGKYTLKRMSEVHKNIYDDIFKNKENAKPEKGKEPTFIFLGGRGGSGKSKFNGLVYDKSKYIVLDADAIKEKLPEYKGYNAWEVHEESSDILKRALEKAKKENLNVVLDATMKSLESSEKHLKNFKDAGYNIEMYYMHLPRELSTQRAIGRFMGERGRYVPIKELLKMQDNEKNFDKLKSYASKWAFYDNTNGSKDTMPDLVAKNY